MICRLSEVGVFIVILDHRPESRAALIGRVQEALRQADVKRFDPYELDRFHLNRVDWALVQGVVLGPGCQSELPELVRDIRRLFPQGRIAAILKREDYHAKALQLRVELGVLAMAEGDLAQLTSFVIECDQRNSRPRIGENNRGVVGLCHFKGGVGCTTLVAALGACWTKHDLSVALVDFDDVSPRLTAWSQADPAHRETVSEFLRIGEVPDDRLNEILSPVDGYNSQLVVVPQPVTYADGFHFKSNAIPDAPCIRTYIEVLLTKLSQEFDVVAIDLGSSWGLATFVALSLCQRIMLVMDDDPLAVQQSLDCCERIIRESNNDALLGIKNWSMVLNKYTGSRETPVDLQARLEQIDLFPPSRAIHCIPYSNRGRSWSAPAQTLYQLSDAYTNTHIQDLACAAATFARKRKRSLLQRWLYPM